MGDNNKDYESNYVLCINWVFQGRIFFSLIYKSYIFMQRHMFISTVHSPVQLALDLP